MGNYNFKKDLVLGEKGEETIKNLLEEKGRKFISFNKTKDYDLLMEDKNGKRFSYEIKTDVYCTPTKDTGNIYVEFESWGREAGIMVCKADWFVYYFQNLNQIWFIKIDKLKKIIDEHKNDKSKIILANFGGDRGSNTKGYLLKRKNLSDYFHVEYL